MKPCMAFDPRSAIGQQRQQTFLEKSAKPHSRMSLRTRSSVLTEGPIFSSAAVNSWRLGQRLSSQVCIQRGACLPQVHRYPQQVPVVCNLNRRVLFVKTIFFASCSICSSNQRTLSWIFARRAHFN